jgi:hypothetical protein
VRPTRKSEGRQACRKDTFNWDLVLDHSLFGSDELTPQSYGLAKTLGDGPIILKPHGSLNWYEATQIRKKSKNRFMKLFPSKDPKERIMAFLRPREVKSKAGRRYTPLIVPPAFLKDFSRPIFRQLWRRCTELLSTPKELTILGYSLPAADLHSQFIFRCGFHNQIEGRIRKSGGRHAPTGPAKVIIVNPDQEAARRIEAIAGPRIPCSWIPKRIEDWLDNNSQVPTDP